MSVMDAGEVASKSNFFNILIDGSTIHGEEKEGAYIQSFKEKNSWKEEIRLLLLNLTDVRDVSINANALKTGLGRSFDLIKEHCAEKFYFELHGQSINEYRM